jgi:hypothetical protein
LRALALGGENTVKVFEDHQRGRILGSFFEQVENLTVLLFHVAQVECVRLDVWMRRHYPDGCGLSIPRRPPEKVSASIRQIMISKPFFALEEWFEVRFYQAPGGWIEDDGIPVISSLQARPSVCGFQISLRLILYLLQQQENFCGILSGQRQILGRSGRNPARERRGVDYAG